MAKNPKIMSYNVKGLRNSLKRKKIIYLLHQWKVDIALLQETHSSVEDEKIWCPEWGGGHVFFSHGETNARGVAIFIAKNFSVKIENMIKDNEGRILAILIDIQGVTFTIVNVYSPNQDNPTFFQRAFEMADSFGNDLRLIAGDFNTVLDLDRDIQGGKGCSNSRTRSYILDYMSNNDFVDIWRLRNPDLFHYTFATDNLRERIDFFLLSSALAQLVIEANVHYILKVSDHAPVFVTLQIISTAPGKGYWKFNNALLQDEVFFIETKRAILEVVSNLKESSACEKWEMIKMAIREKAIIRSSRLTKSRKNKVLVLEKKIKFLHDKNLSELQGVFQNSGENQILKLQTELDEEAEGRMLRSGARWFEFGEKSSQYFLNLEKHNHNRKTILKIEHPTTGEVFSDPDTILQVLTNYYKDLFIL